MGEPGTTTAEEQKLAGQQNGGPRDAASDSPPLSHPSKDEFSLKAAETSGDLPSASSSDPLQQSGPTPAAVPPVEILTVEHSPPVYSLQRRESVSLQILATLAVFMALYMTRAIMLPIVLACLLALTLRPVVRKLRRWGIPENVSALLILAATVVGFSFSAAKLIGPARAWVAEMPEHLEVLKEKLHGITGRFSELTASASKMEKMAAGDIKNRPIPVEIKQSSLSTNVAVLSNTGNMVGSTLLVLGLCYFMLAFGDALLNNVLHLLGTFSDKKRTVELIYDIERGVASYLFTVTIINILLGVATGMALWILGVPNAGLWGVMATLLNYIPVFGAIVGFVIVGVVSILSFESMAYAIIPPVTFIALTSIEGNLITPSVLGKSMSLNPILVFVALIFWGWIWGIGGAFLAVPLLAVAKLACERFEKTRAFAVLMEA